MLRQYTPSDSVRFWAKVQILGLDDCWEWQAARHSSGYGKFSHGHSRHVAAHRAAYSLAHGQIPPGAHILHSCDNPPCCNPRHLRAGTNRDNILDAVRRGRTNHGGQHNGMARLTEEMVREIRHADWGSLTNEEIGQRFGVSRETVRMVRKGQRWSGAR